MNENMLKVYPFLKGNNYDKCSFVIHMPVQLLLYSSTLVGTEDKNLIKA